MPSVGLANVCLEYHRPLKAPLRGDDTDVGFECGKIKPFKNACGRNFQRFSFLRARTGSHNHRDMFSVKRMSLINLPAESEKRRNYRARAGAKNQREFFKQRATDKCLYFFEHAQRIKALGPAPVERPESKGSCWGRV